MAFESTAINDLVAGLQQKPLARESDDWLFGEGDDATQIDPRAGEHAPEFDPMRAVELPRPFAQMPMPMPMPVAPARYPSATSHVRAFDWLAVAKKLILPTMVISIVSVALGIYFAVTDDAPRASAGAAIAEEAPTPVETSVEAAAAAPVEPAAAAPVAPAVEPAVERVELTAAVTPIDESAHDTAPDVAPVAATEPAAELAPVADKVEVPPGSPASRFLAPPPVETTIKTVARPAPAPSTVTDLVPAPPAAHEPAPAEPAQRMTKSAPATKRTTKPVARKKVVRASKARTTRKTVAAAPEREATPETKPAPAVTGKGILSIASTPSLEVWVDGRNSKAMTPVRIKLLAGTHKVTLMDKQTAKARSFEIEIKPDETTTITKNYQ